MLNKEALRNLATQGMWSTQEKPMETARKKQQLCIGIPAECSFQESRVPLVPEAVSLLINNGNEVIIETGAGKKCSFQDKDYSEAGAQITYNKQEVYQKSNLILKVTPPSDEEIEWLTPNQILFSALQFSGPDKKFIQKLLDKKITAVAWDFIKDEDEDIYTVIRAMGEIAGNTSVLIAGELLSSPNGGQGLLLGGIAGVKPAEVVILGAGTVGEYAAKTAMGLGASIQVFDNSIYKLRRLQNWLGRVPTSIIQPKMLRKSLKTADVVIGAIRGKTGRCPCIVTEDMVSDMKFGSVIVDVSIDHGGCFETSEITNHDKPTYSKYGVIHYCVPNIPSRVPRTASQALSNIFAPLLVRITEDGGLAEYIKYHQGLRNGVYMFRGTLTSQVLGEAYNIPYKTLDLLFAAL